jgi:hypothetical protein
MLDDGRIVDVQNVIWSAGFRRDFSWIRLRSRSTTRPQTGDIDRDLARATRRRERVKS